MIGWSKCHCPFLHWLWFPQIRPCSIDQFRSMEQQHFLVVAYSIQSHINPARHLAARLASVTGARVTVSTTVSGHRTMFPSAEPPDLEVAAGPVSYIPFSDGFNGGFKFGVDDSDKYKSLVKVNGSRTLSAILDRLAARGRSVTCVICTVVMPWASDVARQHGIPSAIYWIQPAASFVCFYHYFHGHEKLIASHAEDRMFPVSLPGLPPLRIRDLPSFLTITSKDKYSLIIVEGLREAFNELDQQAESQRPRVLVNTLDSLEEDALRVMKSEMEVFAIGPVAVPKEIPTGSDLFQEDEKGYMEWLDTKPARSVVYVSFGSLTAVKRRQMEELALGLRESGRPYLWALRKDNGEGVELEGGNDGMVVTWCNQVRVLSHGSVGCFVTHCGWNSTLESLACGVPMVGVPQWAEQGTNARLMGEEGWGIGVRAEVDEEGMLPAAELKRCLEVVIGEGKRGEEIRKKTEMWKEKASEAVEEGGSSERNLRAFVEEIARLN